MLFIRCFGCTFFVLIIININDKINFKILVICKIFNLKYFHVMNVCIQNFSFTFYNYEFVFYISYKNNGVFVIYIRTFNDINIDFLKITRGKLIKEYFNNRNVSTYFCIQLINNFFF